MLKGRLAAVALAVALSLGCAGTAWADQDVAPGTPTATAPPKFNPGCFGWGCGNGVEVPGSPAAGGGGQTPPAGGGDSGAVDSGSGGSSSPSGSGSGSGSGGGQPTQQCEWKTFDPPPAASSPLWNGQDPSSGSLQWNTCILKRAGSPAVANLIMAPGATRFVGNGETPDNAAPPPPPDPAELAQQAYSQIQIPRPTMHFGPNDDQIAVRYWLYLWTDDPGPLTSTVTAGGVTVTGTAKLQSVTWSMGSPGASDQGSTVTCTGPGKPAPVDADVINDPRPAGYCAFQYALRSTPDRTGGSGTWPVAASATWTYDWVASTGENGQIAAPPFVSAAGVCVGAWSTVNVTDGYTPPNGSCQT